MLFFSNGFETHKSHNPTDYLHSVVGCLLFDRVCLPVKIQGNLV